MKRIIVKVLYKLGFKKLANKISSSLCFVEFSREYTREFLMSLERNVRDDK
jgi:hypothetical protein